MTIAKLRSVLGAETSDDIKVYHTVLTGVAASVGMLRPFVETRVVNTLRPTDASLYIIAGLNIRIGAGT